MGVPPPAPPMPPRMFFGRPLVRQTDPSTVTITIVFFVIALLFAGTCSLVGTCATAQSTERQ